MNSCFSHVRPRLADMKDLAGIAALEMTVFSHPWNEEMVSSSIQGAYDHVKILETSEGEIAGYIIYSAVCDSADLLRVAVDAGSRRRGIGCKLMEAMIDDCKDRNVQSIFLEVRESNAAAIAMYEQFGFIKISTRKNTTTHRWRMVWLCKNSCSNRYMQNIQCVETTFARLENIVGIFCEGSSL